ncbi:MAG: transposase, partial [Candidatus Peribacteraceae bacterium]|nr:transposase [Candidatus Peribacteraceae bacterium]
KRLELPHSDKEEQPLHNTNTLKPIRKVDENFFYQLAGMKNYSIPISAPGIFALWVYVEELGLFSFLDNLGLTKYTNRQKYSWFDLLLFEIARHFYGIQTSSASCELQCIDISLFANIYKPPCNDTLLNGLRSISEKQVFNIRHWLVDRLAQLGLSTGKYIAFDFHHIDQDVLLPELRNFGKGPSPKKKVCATGFRPHIAWDIGDNTLLVAEFRKASARGTTTVKRFTRDYILPTFRGLFDTVYLDSEYTGKDVWNFVLDENDGMGAHLTACLKQNPMVKNARDHFLSLYVGCENFWRYYDNNHVYSDKTFEIEWEYKPENAKKQRILKLTCVVKKHITTGRLRCFGSSKKNVTAKQILKDYSSRWVIENGIKDLIGSYFLDKCPGTDPHLVDIHFLIVTVCKILFRMVERDLKQHISNPDGSVKTLSRMRDILFRTGAASIKIQHNEFLVKYANSFSIPITTTLNEWNKLLNKRQGEGLEILGGMKINFDLKIPVGAERRNSEKKVPISDLKNFKPAW